MSQGSTPPIPLPGPWQKYSGVVSAVLLAITTFLAGMRQIPTPTPTPLPAPHNDKEQPAPAPQPVPEPIPPTAIPIADFTITDAAGNLVTSTIGVNQQIIVNGTKAIKGSDPSSMMYLVKPAVQKYQAGDLMIITTPSAFSVVEIQQIVALGDRIATKTVTLQVGQNHGPQPPPDPQPQPQPTPQPFKRTISVTTIEDPRHRTPDTAIFLEGMRTWDAFKMAGNSWKNSDPEVDKATADLIASKNIKVPAIVVKDSSGTLLSVQSLPAPSDRVTFIKSFTGDL